MLASITATAQFSGGNGTQADPYQITSKADLELLADIVNGSIFSAQHLIAIGVKINTFFSAKN